MKGPEPAAFRREGGSMARRTRLLAFLMVALWLAGCQRAAQYPPAERPPAKPPEKELDKVDGRLRWIEPRRRHDLPDPPIVFVPDTSPEWQHLPRFWNHFPAMPLHLAQ